LQKILESTRIYKEELYRKWEKEQQRVSTSENTDVMHQWQVRTETAKAEREREKQARIAAEEKSKIQGEQLKVQKKQLKVQKEQFKEDRGVNIANYFKSQRKTAG
jgi:hypothetical protein